MSVFARLIPRQLVQECYCTVITVVHLEGVRCKIVQSEYSLVKSTVKPLGFGAWRREKRGGGEAKCVR